MQLLTVLVFGLGLTSTSSGYIVTQYKDEHCTGASEELNVWDNTCATTNYAAKSVKVEVYGGWNQKVYFYTSEGCVAGKEIRGPWYADHENDSWKREECISMDGWEVNAFGSRL